MNSKQVKVGSVYRLKSSPDYGFVKVVEIFKPMSRITPDLKRMDCYIVKCLHSPYRNFTCEFVLYFKLVDILGPEVGDVRKTRGESSEQENV